MDGKVLWNRVQEHLPPDERRELGVWLRQLFNRAGSVCELAQTLHNNGGVHYIGADEAMARLDAIIDETRCMMAVPGKEGADK